MSESSDLNIPGEIAAGATTFVTAAYIIAVHPDILSQTGMPKPALITVTCLTAGLGTLLYALWVRVPLMMAPGMGLNAAFAFDLCGRQGLPWETALGVVFLSGAAFLVLSLVGIRERVAQAIPAGLRCAIAAGIGLFLAFIGLKNLGLVVDHPVTFVDLVDKAQVTPSIWLGLLGLLVLGALQTLKVPGAYLIAIVSVTALGVSKGVVDAPSRWFAAPASIAPVAAKLDIVAACQLSLWPVIFSFAFVDLFDSIGTLMGVAPRAGLADGSGEVRELGKMLTADAVATVGGAVLGTSTTTTYIESAAGVAAGGRTGLTSATTGVLFLASAALWPAVLAVPPWATAPALIAVGATMMGALKQVDFDRFDEALPALLIVALMPLTFGISHGIMFGFASWALLKVLSGRWQELDPVMLLISALCGVQIAIELGAPIV